MNETLKDKPDEIERIKRLLDYLGESTIRLRQLSITMRETTDNMQANLAYDMWLREMQKFEHLTSHLKQITMGANIPPFY